jgi:hypothetical protein
VSRLASATIQGPITQMATRQYRLAEFAQDSPPPSGQPLELLCEDHCGTYVIPYLCHWAEGAWHAVESGKQIQAVVVGWRARAERCA